MNFNRIFFICAMMVGMQIMAMDSCKVVPEPGRHPLTAMAQVKSPFSTATEEQLKAAMDQESFEEPEATEDDIDTSPIGTSAFLDTPAAREHLEKLVKELVAGADKEGLEKLRESRKANENFFRIIQAGCDELEELEKQQAEQPEPATPRSELRAELKTWYSELGKFETEIAPLEKLETFDSRDHATYVENISEAWKVAENLKNEKAAILESDKILSSEVEGIFKRLTDFQERLGKAESAYDAALEKAKKEQEQIDAPVLQNPAVPEALSASAAAQMTPRTPMSFPVSAKILERRNSLEPKSTISSITQKPRAASLGGSDTTTQIPPLVRQEMQRKLEIQEPTPQPVPAPLITPTKPKYNWKVWLGIGTGMFAVAAAVIGYYFWQQKSVALHS